MLALAIFFFFDDCNAQYYKIINKATSKCIDVSGGKVDNGTPIIQWEFKGSNNQLWEFKEENGYVQIINKGTGKCIDVEGAKQDDGTKIIQWENNKGNNQFWEVTQDEKGFYRFVSKATGKALSVSGPSDPQLIQMSVSNNSYQLWEIHEVQ
ncbi:MAG: RICIN domain-containing protein [Chloroherpetonaceae bacterium]|nr:RICIN domain-containing protein [Chloroherpetonaceae bacterium]